MNMPTGGSNDKKLVKVVAIVGTTAVGKSKLGIELARHLDGEVVSADSMQIYNGLDIATAKVTKEEVGDIPHHMLSIVDLDETGFTVKDYTTLALERISDIVKRGKVPVIVGGTFYYLESLMYHSFMSEGRPRNNVGYEDRVKSLNELKDRGLSLHQQLADIDVLMANRIHPNNTRRIENSISVYIETGELHSSILSQEQKKSRRLRFDVCMIWLDAQVDVILSRISTRIDTMLEDGLLEEVDHVFTRLTNQEQYEKKLGIVQAIGYKEFLPYLGDVTRNPEILKQCITTLRSVTNKYAKKQLQWIRNRLQEEVQLDIYRLDTSDISVWDSKVLVPSLEITSRFMEDQPEDPLLYQEYASKLPTVVTISNSAYRNVMDWKNNVCDKCDQTLYGRHEIEKHLKSRSHRKRRLNNKKYDKDL